MRVAEDVLGIIALTRHYDGSEKIQADLTVLARDLAEHHKTAKQGSGKVTLQDVLNTF